MEARTPIIALRVRFVGSKESVPSAKMRVRSPPASLCLFKSSLESSLTAHPRLNSYSTGRTKSFVESPVSSFLLTVNLMKSSSKKRKVGWPMSLLESMGGEMYPCENLS